MFRGVLPSRRPALLLSGALLLPFLVSGEARGDLVRLNDGQILHGTIVNSDGTRTANRAGNEPAKPISIRLLDGTVKEVDGAEIGYTIIRPLKFEEYEDRQAKVAETLDAHWELAEWCRKNGLDNERRYHLERVLDFDPGYEKAHRALGEVNVDGEWISIDEKKAREGLVKYKGRYVKPEEILSDERMQALKGAEREWMKKIRDSYALLIGSDKPTALRDLNAISDPTAIKGLLHFLQNDPQIENRKLLIQILGRIHAPDATRALVVQGLFDSKKEVSDLAFAAVPVSARPEAVALLIKALRHSSNDVVNRAGAGLGMLGAKSAIGPLIVALVTDHEVPVPTVITTPSSLNTLAYGQLPILDESRALPVRNPYAPGPCLGYGYGSGYDRSYLSGGSYALLYGFGGPKWAPMVERHVVTEYRKVSLENPMVRASLRELTGQDFGYNEETWKQWWADQQPVRKVP